MVVRVLPGANLGATFGFDGAAKGKPATAVYYRLGTTGNYEKFQEIALLNPIAPLFAAVADTGELVTLDNWHNVGTGESVLAVYAPDGKVRRSYRMVDLYTIEELGKFEGSVSSVWWRCPADPTLDHRSGMLEFKDMLGANVRVNLSTGDVSRKPSSQKPCLEVLWTK